MTKKSLIFSLVLGIRQKLVSRSFFPGQLLSRSQNQVSVSQKNRSDPTPPLFKLKQLLS